MNSFEQKELCPWCGNTITASSKNIIYKDFYQNRLLPGLILYRCPDCGIWYAQGDTTFDEEYHSEYYSTLSVQGKKKWLMRMFWDEARRNLHYPEKKGNIFLRWMIIVPLYKVYKIYNNIELRLPEYVMGGSVFEVGCGRGSWLKSMGAEGWKTYGIEPSEYVLTEEERNIYHIKKIKADEIRDNINELFDVVYASFVLEHLYCFKDVLDVMCSILKINGELLLSVPNGESLAFRVFGKYWHNLDLPRHKIIFTPGFANTVAEKYGLKLVYCKCHSGTIGITISVYNVCTSIIASKKTLHMIRSILLSRLTHIALLPFVRIIDAVGWGDTMYWRFKKK